MRSSIPYNLSCALISLENGKYGLALDLLQEARAMAIGDGQRNRAIRAHIIAAMQGVYLAIVERAITCV